MTLEIIVKTTNNNRKELVVLEGFKEKRKGNLGVTSDVVIGHE